MVLWTGYDLSHKYQLKVFSSDRSVMFVENGNHEHLAELGAICEIFINILIFNISLLRRDRS